MATIPTVIPAKVHPGARRSILWTVMASPPANRAAKIGNLTNYLPWLACPYGLTRSSPWTHQMVGSPDSRIGMGSSRSPMAAQARTPAEGRLPGRGERRIGISRGGAGRSGALWLGGDTDGVRV